MYSFIHSFTDHTGKNRILQISFAIYLSYTWLWAENPRDLCRDEADVPSQLQSAYQDLRGPPPIHHINP